MCWRLACEECGQVFLGSKDGNAWNAVICYSGAARDGCSAYKDRLMEVRSDVLLLERVRTVDERRATETKRRCQSGEKRA